MASRSTRSQGKNAQVTSTSANNPFPSTPLRNRARKSMGTPPTKVVASKKNQSKRPRSSSDSSIDSSNANVHSTTAVLSQVRGSSDSEDAGPSFKGKRMTKRTQRRSSPTDSGGSDDDYSPPVKATGRGRRGLSSTSGIRQTSTPVSNVSHGITNISLNTSQGPDTSMNTSTQGKIGGTQEMKWVNKCVSYILVADRKKHAIKKADIIKNVFENQNSKEHYSTVLVKANAVLKKTFGMEILQLQNTSNSYILVNILSPENEIREFVEYTSEEQQKRGLVFLLLTIIFMNENSIAEDKLWKALEPLGLYPNCTIPHPVFGNVKKYITVELVKELYLEYTCKSKDPVQYEFKWGERAGMEFKKEDLLEFACEIIGDNVQPEDWKLQFIDAKESSSEA